jgi:hypothetical protein
MITEEMLDVYAKFNGDIDGFSRAGTAHERCVINDEQWSELSAFLQELFLVKTGSASAEYAEKLNERLTQLSASSKVKERLWKLA